MIAGISREEYQRRIALYEQQGPQAFAASTRGRQARAGSGYNRFFTNQYSNLVIPTVVNDECLVPDQDHKDVEKSLVA